MMTGMVSSGYFLTFPFRRKGSMNKLVLLSRHRLCRIVYKSWASTWAAAWTSAAWWLWRSRLTAAVRRLWGTSAGIAACMSAATGISSGVSIAAGRRSSLISIGSSRLSCTVAVSISVCAFRRITTVIYIDPVSVFIKVVRLSFFVSKDLMLFFLFLALSDWRPLTKLYDDK